MMHGPLGDQPEISSAATTTGLVAALEREEKTRHEPDVVTSLPPAPAHMRTPVAPLTPTLRKLPRP